MDFDNDIVGVFRWIRNDRELNKVIEKLMASLAPPSTQQQH